MSNPNASDRLSSETSEFISTEQAMRFLWGALRQERIDGNGFVRPLEVQRKLHDPSKYLLPPSEESAWMHGVVIPDEKCRKIFLTKDKQGTFENEIEWSAKDSVYGALIGRTKRRLSDQEVNDLALDEQKFLRATKADPHYAATLDKWQLYTSYGLSREEPTQPEFNTARIYAAGGLGALSLVRQVVQAGADFEKAKIWVPQSGRQSQFLRSDTPIFMVQSLKQLRSTLQAIKRVQTNNPHEIGPTPLLGQMADGLPGVVVAQAAHGRSFNGTMRKVFGSSLEIGCEEAGVYRDRVDGPWLSVATKTMVEHAKLVAASEGVNMRNHAFLSGQPLDAILDVVRSVR